METKTYIQQQLANAHRQVDAVMKDLTEEQFNWLPPGTISPISAILVHVLGGEDFFVQGLIRGKSRCWEDKGWGEKIGVQVPPGPGHGWDEFKTIKVSIAPVLSYGQEVRLATYDCVKDLTAEELARQVNFAGRMIPVAEVLMILVVHIAGHAGEIAAVKGMQGIQGLPF